MPDLPPASPPLPSGPQQTQAPGGQAASVAWAIATTVVAIVVGFLVWTWMTRDVPAETTTPSVNETAGAAVQAPDAGEPVVPQAEGDEDQATLSPEQEQVLLDLQRREDGDPLALGTVDAPVVLIEYADYRCPYCAKWALEVKPGLQPLVDDGTLRIEFRDTIIFGEESALVAIAARAAGEQGMYWDYHDAIFAAAPATGHADLPKERLVELAAEVGVPDLERFEADLSSQELLDAVQADMGEAQSLGVRSTPTFIVNTVPVRGSQPIEVFTQLVEQQAALAP
jgi:protein-disulfide isomerase